MFSPNFASPPESNLYTMDGLEDTLYGGDGNPTFDPNDFINTDLMSSPMPSNAQLNFGPPAVFLPKTEHPQFQPRSVVSSASPESSTQDSSSDSSGRRKRKSPSTSSAGVTFGSYPSHDSNGWAGNSMDLDRKRRAKVDSPVLKQEDSGMGVLNNSMTESFNIKSAANSPPVLVDTPSSTRWNAGTPRSMTDQDYAIMPVRTRSPATFNFGSNSRDNTPPSALSFDSNHTPFLMMRDSPDTDGLSFPTRTPFGGMGDSFTMFNTPPPPIQTTTNMSTIRPADVGPYHLRFHVSPLGNKSRVETQIPIKLTLDPLPPGIKRMHLPTETIAKAKFLAKDSAMSPDSLELSAMLVCTSAMEVSEKKQHALRMAQLGSHLLRGSNPRRSSTGDTKKSNELDPSDPNSPANGGPVRICDNCVSRERKRAGRKKAKKQEDEERWHEFEHDRIIMFNTQEYLEFHPPSPSKEPAYYENTSFSPDAMQVDAPMRIVCYCRHQQEKVGFQVIFTVKDYQGRVIAQSITQSILITDDHKTHTQGAPSTTNLAVAESAQYGIPGFSGPVAPVQHGLPGRAYHSSTNLAGLGNQQSYWSNLTNTISQGQTSATMTPRNLSRPASPSGHTGPKKKRKGSSGQHKIPASLMMTRSELEPMSTTPMGVTSAPQSTNSIISPAMGPLGFDTGLRFSQYNTSPPTPEAATVPASGRQKSTDDYFYSAPNSTHASRAASPVSFARQSMGMYQPQAPQANASTFSAMQFGTEETHPVPNIYKIRPDRGPITGNIEIVILGKNFHRNLEVMFGEMTATTTTFWNSDTLVCLLPPAIRAGPVPVTFTTTNRQGYSSPSMASATVFTYVDDTKQQLFELAIQLQCAAQMGPGADHFQYAQNILTTQGPNTPFSSGQISGYNGNVLGSANTEDLILAIINKVDLIDSPFTPFYDHRREGGSTMLSLACRLGYERLVAGLLIRGADYDAADVGGFTPLMYAASHGHIAIVRRLILRGGDPSLRNLRGLSAAGLASTLEVRHYVRHRRHYRSMSAGTPYLRSRANSAASTRSLWGPPSSGASSTMYSTEDESALDTEDEETEVVAPLPQSALQSRRPSLAMLSRRPSLAVLLSRRGSEVSPVNSASLIPTVAPEAANLYGTASTIAMFSALRDQLTTQINALQQNLPSMQFSDLLQDQNLPAFGRRFSSLVPMRRDPSVRPESPTADPPPPYHEACPNGVDNDFDTKPSEVFSSGSSTSVATLKPVAAVIAAPTRLRERVTIGKINPTGEEAAELRRLRQEKLTPAKYDRNLWSIWFPLLIMLMIWYFSGLQAPPVMSWIKSFNETLTETFGKALPDIPGRLRMPVAG